MKTNPHDPVNPVEKMSGMNIGITLREHFAAMAMQGLLASIKESSQSWCPNLNTVEYIADLSVSAADELIKSLNKQ